MLSLFISCQTPSSLHIWFFLQVRSLVAQFGPALQAHLSLAFQDLQVYGRRRSCGSEEQSGSLRTEETPRSQEHPRELFQVLLQSQEEAAPCRYLLQEALVQRCPTLAVMAACQQVNRQNTMCDSCYLFIALHYIRDANY